MAGKFPAVQAFNLVMFTEVAAVTSAPEASPGWSRANFREAFAEHPGEAQVQLVVDALWATWALEGTPKPLSGLSMFVVCIYIYILLYSVS